jgi:hypothetical protein
MGQPPEKKPFYLNRNWMIGFVVTMIAVIAYFFLVTRPRQVANAIPTAQTPPAQVGQEVCSSTDQAGAGWKEVTIAPGSSHRIYWGRRGGGFYG